MAQLILTGTSVKNSLKSEQIAANYPHVLYSTAGIHPHEAKSMRDDSLLILQQLLYKPHVVAVGECGLDFDRDFSPRPVQEKCFEAQLALAIAVQKPLFLHERAAFDRFTALCKTYSSQLPKGVVHCFTGTMSQAKYYLDQGFYLGFTGAISDVNCFDYLKEVIAYTPLDRMLLETDAPFMLPKNVPRSSLARYHERRNEPAFLPFVAQTIAQLKQLSIAEVATVTTDNAKAFFSI